MAAGMTQQQLAEWVHVSSRTIISLEKEQRYSLSAAGCQPLLRKTDVRRMKFQAYVAFPLHFSMEYDTLYKLNCTLCAGRFQ